MLVTVAMHLENSNYRLMLSEWRLHDELFITSSATPQCYSLSTVGYRLMTFNDCELASAELLQVGQQA